MERRLLLLDSIFLNTLIQKFNKDEVFLYITDNHAHILASTNIDKIGSTSTTARYILTIHHAASIMGSPNSSNTNFRYGIPVIFDGMIEYVIVSYGQSHLVNEVGDALYMALQTALEYQEYLLTQKVKPLAELDEIASMMLSEKCNTNKLLSLLHRHELDPHLLRSVIYIKLDFYKNNFFNINLNLGYESSIEQLRVEIADRLKRSRYLNSQDLVYIPNRNTILIIKSFLPNEDISTLYLALEAVCKDLVKTLNAFSGLTFSTSYGNFYKEINMIHLSYKEAVEIMDIGIMIEPKPLYTLDELLLNYISTHLLPQIIDKYIVPCEKKLLDAYKTFPTELINTAEAFIDNCFSITATTHQTHIHRNTIHSRLKHFSDLTGLDPTISFKDAFLTKMLVLYLKRKDHDEKDS